MSLDGAYCAYFLPSFSVILRNVLTGWRETAIVEKSFFSAELQKNMFKAS